MSTTNDITGDPIQTKLGVSKKYADNYDRIFRKGTVKQENPVDAELKKATEQIKHIASLCGKHDRMHFVAKLETVYDILEELKND